MQSFILQKHKTELKNSKYIYFMIELILAWNTKRITYAAFYLIKNTKCGSYFTDLKLWRPSYIKTSLRRWKWGNDPLWRIVSMGISTFLVFSVTSVFQFEASALNWSHVFHRVQNVWKWIPVRHCTHKIFLKLLRKIPKLHLIFWCGNFVKM